MSAASRYLAAVDLGSSNGKILLGIARGNDLETVEIHRFDHAAVTRDGKLYWDWQRISAEIIRGLRMAAQAAPPGAIEAVSCDSWAQDFGLLDADGNILETPRCYRDPAFAAALPLNQAARSREEQLNINGVCASAITTLNQLIYRHRFEPESLKNCRRILHVADLVHHLLGGTVTGDPTLLGISQLFKVHSGTVDAPLLRQLGIDPEIIPPPAAGVIGSITHDELRELFPAARLIAGVGHDTAAAFHGAQVKEDEFFISLGSWAMNGCLVQAPVMHCTPPGTLLTLADRQLGFFCGGSGMFLLQRCCAKWKTQPQPFSFAELDAEAMESRCDGMFDLNDPAFSAPDSDVESLIRQKLISGTAPVSRGDTLRAINITLSESIRLAAERAAEICHRQFSGAVMVSGGIRNRELVANFTARTGLKLRCGVQEASAMGNLLNSLQTVNSR